MRLFYLILCFLNFSFYCVAGVGDSSLVKLKVIEGKISPKSIVHSGKGVFFAQNIMYRHTITVYNRSFQLLKTISDKVELKKFGFSEYGGVYHGAPVECAFSSSGKYAWVSNYNMSGGESDEFIKPGCDNCNAKGVYDSSFVYKINADNLEIEAVVKVGAVPKYLAVTPNNKYLLVTNWSSGDLSIVDLNKEKEIKRIRIGTYPRGIVINQESSIAYVAIMGSSKIAKVDLNSFTKTYIEDVGRSPRHLCLSPDGKILYASMNGEGKIAKISLIDNSIEKLKTGSLPRSMEMSKDGKFLYVVNYGSDKLSKVSTESMQVVTSIKTNDKPIGITIDEKMNNVWVACYEGSLMVFHDAYYDDKDSLDVLVNLPDHQREQLNFSVSEERRKANSEKEAEKRSEEKKAELVLSTEAYVGSERGDLRYYLVTGSFKKKQNAENKVEELEKEGYSAFVYYNSENDFTYACAAKYSNRSIAVSQVEKMHKNGESAWVFKMK